MESALVEVESIAAGGDGVARADGLVLFLPRAAPGDVAEVGFEARGRFARASLRRLVRPSPHRTQPQCGHYVRDRCGGCQLQHLQYVAQLEAKRRIVGDAFERIGKRRVAPPEVHPSPREWRYRAKLTLALRRRGERWIAGLHPYDDPRSVFELAECPITDERVLAVWRSVLDAQSHLPPASELRGAVKVDAGAASFVLEGGRLWREHRELFEAVPSLASLWWRPHGAPLRRLESRGDAHAPGASFAQVNAAAGRELHAHVIALALAHRPRTAIDAYAGLGDVGVALAREGTQVTAIELDREAARWCANRLPRGSKAIAARVEDALPDALPADVIVLNPPRAGIDERVAAALDAAAPPPRVVVYVSCNPATLARDLTRLPRFAVASLVAFDMFPQTAHVETVCELIPAA